MEVPDLAEFIKDPVRTLSLGQRMRADTGFLLHNPTFFRCRPLVWMFRHTISGNYSDQSRGRDTILWITTTRRHWATCGLNFYDWYKRFLMERLASLKETSHEMKTLPFDPVTFRAKVILFLLEEGSFSIWPLIDKEQPHIEFDSSRYQSVDIIKQTLVWFWDPRLEDGGYGYWGYYPSSIERSSKMVKLWRQQTLYHLDIQELISCQSQLFYSLSDWWCHGSFCIFYLWSILIPARVWSGL